MEKTDWLGKWFDIYEEMGEYGQSAYAVEDEHNALEFLFLPHQHYDGMGGLHHLIKERSGLEIELPTVKGQEDPSFIKVGWALLHNVILHRTIRPKWIVPRSDERGKKQNPTLLRFTKEETAHIIKAAKTRNISVTTFLLHICDSVVAEILWDEKYARWWMLPVNMRGIIKKTNGNCSSYVVSVIKDESPQVLHDNIKKSLRLQWHRATYILSNIGKLIGISGVRATVKKQYKTGFGWTGNFSNLGVISHDFPSLASETWYGCAPTNRLIPISISAMTFNARLTLAFLIHPSIDPDGTYVIKLRDAVKSDISDKIQ
jgi:hypothetical protein